MNRSRLLMIGGLALAIGLLVSYSVYNRLRTATTLSSAAAGVPVLVAADDIEVGAKLKASDVSIINVPQPSRPPGAFSTATKVLGRGAVLPISKGDFILPNKLAALDAGAGLPSMIPPGMRAVSVRVNDVVSVAGFVQPGTRVDVLDTSTGQTITVLQNVAVIAVGASLLERIAGEQSAPVITSARLARRRAEVGARFPGGQNSTGVAQSARHKKRRPRCDAGQFVVHGRESRDRRGETQSPQSDG
jgi:pilus assembly protein CpaB